MRFILRPRGSGKTSDLVEQCIRDGGCIVSLDRSRAHWATELARRQGHTIPRPLTYEDLRDGQHRGSGIGRFYLDDLDDFLIRDLNLAQASIGAVAWTGESEIVTITPEIISPRRIK
jgi:hypothetical protein